MIKIPALHYALPETESKDKGFIFLFDLDWGNKYK